MVFVGILNIGKFAQNFVYFFVINHNVFSSPLTVFSKKTNVLLLYCA